MLNICHQSDIHKIFKFRIFISCQNLINQWILFLQKKYQSINASCVYKDQKQTLSTKKY